MLSCSDGGDSPYVYAGRGLNIIVTDAGLSRNWRNGRYDDLTIWRFGGFFHFRAELMVFFFFLFFSFFFSLFREIFFGQRTQKRRGQTIASQRQ